MLGANDLSNESLLPGPTTFTLERIKTQLAEDTLPVNPDVPGGGIPSPFICEGLNYSFEDEVHRIYTTLEQDQLRERFCRDLYEQVIEPESHCSRLDHQFSQIVSCNIQIEAFAQLDPDSDLTKEMKDILDGTYHLLTRLPATPLRLSEVPLGLSPYYDVSPGGTETATIWQDLQVTSYVSTNVIRTALISVIYRGRASHMLQDFINTIADLIGTASTLSSSADSELARHRWFVVQAFLWTSWQRCTMIYFYSILGGYLRSGFSDHDGPSLLLRGMQISPGLSIQEMSRNHAKVNKPRYMCGWAFELLRSDPISIGLDFRRFFLRYSMAFGDRPGRCLLDRCDSCRGDEPGKCQRFKGMRIENQSLHDDVCQGDCERMTWDEESYRSISGARAVALDISDSRKRMIYRQASADTLAISHVWSHGQGGRPEAGHGFNNCLHRRYISIARSLGCDSYWMDTPCIPKDHKLRRQAIENINYVFEQSKATLVCDKDLMDIDASDPSVEVHELILATVMVCDWNVRAWTFLEAFRGRESIHILCRDNVIIPLRKTVEIVYGQGSIEIALLLLSVPHLLSPQIKKDFQAVSGSSFEVGFLLVETAGSLLSHREASRPGDDIVIWSLLLGDKLNKGAIAFWKSRQKIGLSTSFLVSSVPRLKKRSLGWAPSSPTAQLVRMRANGPQTRLLAFDGMDSDRGIIEKDGFRAPWFMYDFIGPCIGVKRLSSFLEIHMQPDDMSCQANLRKIRRRYLKGYLWGAILRPIDARTSRKAAVYRGDTSKTLVVVCATNKRFMWYGEKDDRIHWQWRGVYEWDMAEPLPKFVLTEDVLLV